jgi:hypothetical protein
MDALFVEVPKLDRTMGAQARYGGAGRDEAACQREPTQCAVLRAREQAGDALAAGSPPGSKVGDNGYLSVASVDACAAADIEPLIALVR